MPATRLERLVCVRQAKTTTIAGRLTRIRAVTMRAFYFAEGILASRDFNASLQ
jgi:hypothetical protein